MCPYWNGISFDEKAASFGGHVKYQAVSYMYGSNSDYICSSLWRDLCSDSKILLQDFGKSRVKERWKKRADMRAVSYTHLDVYKRQVLWSIKLWQGTMILAMQALWQLYSLLFWLYLPWSLCRAYGIQRKRTANQCNSCLLYTSCLLSAQYQKSCLPPWL